MDNFTSTAMRKHYLLCSLPLLGGLMACQQALSLGEAGPAVVTADTSMTNVVELTEEKSQKLRGTVQFLPMEGGFWGIVTDDGRHILPLGLPKAYHKPGLQIRFTATPKRIMTTQQWGEPAEVDDIEVLADGHDPGKG